MQRGRIFVQRAGGLVAVQETPYDAEARLQELLAAHPDLLGGDQITPEDPRRWLLVKREAGVRHEADSAYQWSLDHLFADHEAIPTLVEVKRATDTRSRREVVAQMLDYAANGIGTWDAAELLAHAERTHGGPEGLAARIRELVRGEEDPPQFFARVAQNMADGKMRLMFVADEIPSRLLTIIQFLDQQFANVRVLGVEVRQFTSDVGGEIVSVLVPRVLGSSEAVRVRKEASARRGEVWTRDEYLEQLEEEARTPEHAALHRRLLELAERLAADRLVQIDWGRGSKSGSFTLRLARVPLLSAFTYGSVNANIASWLAWGEPRARELVVGLGTVCHQDWEPAFDAGELSSKFPNVASELLAYDPALEGLGAWLRTTIAATTAS